MGGGRKLRHDVPRRRGVDILQAVAQIGAAGAANGGSLSQVAEFCARDHRVSVGLATSSPPAVGDSVHLERGSPPVVVNGGGAIGTVQDDEASALNGCLLTDWQMVGEVVEVDLPHRRAAIVVSGAR